MPEIIRVRLAGGLYVSLCPSEGEAVREQMLGRTAFGPQMTEALAMVEKTFPGARVVEIRRIEK